MCLSHINALVGRQIPHNIPTAAEEEDVAAGDTVAETSPPRTPFSAR